MIGQGLGRIALAEKLSIGQLQEAIENRTIPAYIGIPLLEEKVQLEQRMRMAGQRIAPPMDQPPIAEQVMAQANAVEGQGIDALPVGDVVNAAGGGIVAFEDGGAVRFQNQGYVDPMFSGIYSEPSMPRNELVDLMTLQELQEYNRSGLIPPRLKDAVGGRQVESGSFMFGIPAMRGPAQFAEPVPETPAAPAAPAQTPPVAAPAQAGATKPPAAAGIAPPPTGQRMAPSGEMSVEDFKKRQEAFGISGDPDADLRKQIEDMAAGSKSEREQAKYMALLQAGLGMMGGTSPFAMQNIAAGAQKGLAQYAGDIKDIKAQERDVMKMRGELARAADARKRGDFKAYMDAEDKARKYNLDLAEQATRDRIAGIQEQYYAGRLSADQAKTEIARERNKMLVAGNLIKARKQYMEEGGDSKLRSEFEKRFGKNWEKDPRLMQSFKQQIDAEINKLAMMETSGIPSADDLLGD